MDFAFTDEQLAVAEAAAGVFGGFAERVAAVEQAGDRFDEALWRALADADLLGLAVPEVDGGSGLGITELCLLLEAQGRAVAPVPLWATLVLGALPLAAFGTAAQRARWLPGVVSGDVRLSAALDEVARSAPTVSAEAVGHGWRLAGRCAAVPQAHLATRVLVPATAPDGRVVVGLVDPAALALERAETTDRQIWPHLRLDGVEVGPEDVVDVPVQWMLTRAHVGLAAMALGVAEEALARTAVHLNERHQFGRPLSSFQAVMVRAADAYIDTEAMRVTLWEAAWRLDTGRAAGDAVAAARWWASEAGQRVVHAAQHLHGGIGADVGYPIHRYFLWGKQLELALEGPSAQLARLGARIAAGEPA